MYRLLKKISTSLPIIISSYEYSHKITIHLKMAYDGALYYNIGMKERWDKIERKSRQQWEQEQMKQKGKEDTDASIKAAVAALANRQRQLEKEKIW